MNGLKPIVGLKIGGSIATKKDVEDFPLSFAEIKEKAFSYIKVENLKRIGIEEILPTIPKLRIFLGLGVGPFGHYLVKHVRKLRDVAIIHKSVSYYAALVTKILGETGLPVSYEEKFSPFNTCFYEGGRLHTEKLERWVGDEMKGGKIPIFHGDIIQCKDCRGSLNGFEVLSSDRCLSRLAITLGAVRIVAATDVDGLYSEDPKLSPGARFIPVVKAEEEIKMKELTGSDVTGMIPQKIREFQEAARFGVEALIVNGLVRGRIMEALLGRKCKATIIMPQKTH